MADDVIEPELLTPTPRPFRRSWRARFMGWIFGILSVGAPVALAGFGWLVQRDWTAMREHGTKVVGKVVDLEAPTTGKDSHGPRAKFEYRPADEPLSFWEDITDEEYGQLKRGDERSITYLAEHPSTATSTVKLERDGERSTTALALTVTGGILALIAWPARLWLERNQRRWRRLIAYGVPARTTAVRVTRTQVNDNTESWTAYYDVLIHGENRSGKSGVDADIGLRLAETGTQATVLYDPDDLQVFELYEPMARMYPIEVAPTANGSPARGDLS